jgi:tRNA threonylcarbamoyladenosine biosynthesis protein TsaE
MKFQRLSDNSASFETTSASETISLGAEIGKCAYPGLTVLLFGSLGMGKTQLTQGIGRTLGYNNVKSPTFILVSEHEGRLPLIHVDLYRLEEKDVDALALEDYLTDGCLLVVEWAERWIAPPAEDCWKISFSSSEADDCARNIKIASYGKKASEALAKFCGAFGEKQ